MAAAMYVMGRNSDLTYDPETFIPERWITNDTSLDLFYNSVPFGFGPRGCIGSWINIPSSMHAGIQPNWF